MQILIAFPNSSAVNNEILISASCLCVFLVFVEMNLSKKFTAVMTKEAGEWIRKHGEI